MTPNNQKLNFTDKQPEFMSNKDKHDTPYLSFVVVARNDDHGKDFLKRMKIFVQTLREQIIQYNLKSELIIVDWNPPKDKPKLSEVVLSWVSSESDVNNTFQIRIIEVPNKIHKKFCYSDKMELFQMIGKNVGIRRAKGEYVVATNVDLIFSDELIKSFVSKSLVPQFFYRIDRYDVDGLPAGDVSEKLSYCKNNILRINRKDGTFSTTSKLGIFFEKFNNYLSNFKNYFSHHGQTFSHYYRYTNAVVSGLFQYGLELFLNYQETRKHENFKSIKEIIEIISKDLLSAIKINVKGILTPFILVKIMLKNTFSPAFPKLHTNACGDFTILSKEKWFELHGYPEIEAFSFNIDSIMLQIAHSYGLKEFILKDPKRMYHMEHVEGWSPESGKKLLEKISDQGIKIFKYDEYCELSAKMHKEKHPIIFNTEDWGLSSENLPESLLNQSKSI